MNGSISIAVAALLVVTGCSAGSGSGSGAAASPTSIPTTTPRPSGAQSTAMPTALFEVLGERLAAGSHTARLFDPAVNDHGRLWGPVGMHESSADDSTRMHAITESIQIQP